MKKIVVSLWAVCISLCSLAQTKVYQSKTGKIRFYSQTKAENIEAINNQTDIKLATNGQLVFSLLVKGFVFKNALMQEHFNENYMESSTHPKASFKGTIDNLKAVDFTKDGVYKIAVSGDLLIHGTTQKQTSLPATIEVKDGKLITTAVFKIKVKDFGIKGNYIGDKIANEIEITVTATLN